MSEQAKGSEHELNAVEVEAFNQWRDMLSMDVREDFDSWSARMGWMQACAWQREQDAARIVELEAELAITSGYANRIADELHALRQASPESGLGRPIGEPVAWVSLERDDVSKAKMYFNKGERIAPLCLCVPPAVKVPECEWRLDDDDTGIYATGCGGLFAITDGTPEENEMRHCPYCGGKITAAPKHGEQP